MRLLRVVVGLFCSASLIGVSSLAIRPQQAAQRAVAEPVKRELIPLYVSERRMLVMMRIGNSSPFPVVFDTGTNGNLIDSGLADALRLPNTGPSPSIDGSTGKPVAGHDTFIKAASLSGVAIDDARATAFPYNLPDEVAIIGPNSFPGKLVRLEGTRNRLVITVNTSEFVPACSAFSYLGSHSDSLPSALLDLAGQKITAILDTGNDSSLILPITWASKLSLESVPKEIGYAVSAAGKQPILSARLNGTLKIGSIPINHPEIRFMKGGKPNVGLSILRNLTLVMDPVGHRDWVLPPAAKGNACTETTENP